MTEVLRQLGRYELLRRIAVGGMGEIFLARMRGAGGFEKRVIIKTILPHLAEEEEFITKFLDEGRIVVQLTHGNIVPVFDMGQHSGEYFIAMEYIPGRDLREVLKRLQVDSQVMPLDMAVYIVSEVCKGLGYAHRKLDEQGQQLDLVHRDVSPSNILISHEGEVKVIDFGIARATGRLSQTVSGRIQGKFSYMSPEQASGKVVDERSDIFSTGVVFYEMLTGVRPFQGESDMESLELVRRCKFDPPSTLNPTIPTTIDEIVEQALSRDPRRRYQTMDQLQEDLLQYLYTQGQAPRTKSFAAFLKGLFPEGFERRDLRFGTGSGSAKSSPGSNHSPNSASPRDAQPGRAVSLDDALDMELGRLLEAGEAPAAHDAWDVNALTATAASDSLDGPRTATLAPTPSSSLLAPDPLEISTPEDDAPSPSPSPEAVQPAQTPSLSPEATPPTGKPAPATPSHPLELPGPAEQTTSPSGPITLSDPSVTVPTGHLDLFKVRGFKRTIGAGVVVLIVLIFGFNVWQERKVGQLEVLSEPSGAEIFIDGAKMPGLVTPTTISLPVGLHTVQLRKPGFVGTEPLSVTLKRGQLVTLPAKDATLTPQLDSPPKARRFQITSEPVGAKLIIDHSANASAIEGVTPWFLELEAGQFANLKVEYEGCKPRAMPVTFDQASDKVNVVLTCAEPKPTPEAPDMTPPPTDPKPHSTNHTQRQRQSVTLRAPSEATIIATTQGKRFEGRGALRFVADKGASIQITATLKGHEPYKNTVNASQIPSSGLTLTMKPQPTGCLTFRAEYPHENEYILDGRSLGKSYGLKAHTLSAGTHTLVVRNTQVNKEESFTLEIPPSESCLSRSVWPRP